MFKNVLKKLEPNQIYNFQDLNIITHTVRTDLCHCKRTKRRGQHGVKTCFQYCWAASLEEAHLLHASTVVPLGRGTGRGVMVVMMMGVGEVAYTSLQFCFYG